MLLVADVTMIINARHVYSTLLYLLSPLLLLRILWKGYTNRKYWQRLNQRFGKVNQLTQAKQPVIWLHAVSVGEVQAAKPLINYLLSMKTYAIYVTTTTPTGSEHLLKLFPEINHGYLPYDFPFSVRSFFNQLQPKLGIIMETELWPNLYYYCQRHHCRILLANARLSPQSCRGYAKIKPLIYPTIKAIDKIATQSQQDQTHFLQLGATLKQIKVTGNIKFDFTPPLCQIQAGKALKEKFSRPVILGASTHDGEERWLLNAFKILQKTYPNLLLIIAPRHPERFAKVHQLAQKNYQVASHSQQDYHPTTEIYIADTLGQLMLFYASADIAILGGSFTPIGGHNPLEPAALSLPIITGQHTFNFKAIIQLFVENKAILIVNSECELIEAIERLLNSQPTRDKIGNAGQQLIQKNKGTLDKLIAMIDEIL